MQYGAARRDDGDADGMTSRTTERMGSLMIGASIPLFARDRQFQMRDEANAMRAMAEADVNAMRAETRGKIGEAYAALTRARDWRGSIARRCCRRRKRRASALSSYRSGRSTS